MEALETFVGKIIPVGLRSARWMFVTKVDGSSVRGHLWSGNQRKWTKTASGHYARDATFRKRPVCPKPMGKPDCFV